MNQSKKSDLGPRLLTSVLVVPLLFWVILGGPPEAWLVVVTLASAIALYEFYDMTLLAGERVLMFTGIGLGTAMVPLVFFAEDSFMVIACLSAATITLFVITVFTFDDKDRAAPMAAFAVSGLIYGGLFMSFLALIRRDPGDVGPYWILLLLAVTWGCDTGAYFAGRAFGKHKLAPKVSPKKTWEGAVGGVAASVVAGVIVTLLTPLDFSATYLLLLVIPASVLGQVGDLFESLIKRSVGVKDSGKIIYGHGGILDRIDALIFSATYFYLFYHLSADLSVLTA